MDVGGVLRRTRLPLVASLFLALLGGASAPALPEPAPAPAAVIAEAAPAAEAEHLVVDLSALPRVEISRALLTPVAFLAGVVLLLTGLSRPRRVRRLTGRVGGAAAAPRAPPVLA